MDWDLVITAATVLIILVQNYNSLIHYIKFIYYYAALLVVFQLMLPYLVVKRQNVFNMMWVLQPLKSRFYLIVFQSLFLWVQALLEVLRG